MVRVEWNENFCLGISEISTFLTQWFINHIMNADWSFNGHLHQHSRE